MVQLVCTIDYISRVRVDFLSKEEKYEEYIQNNQNIEEII